MSATTSIPSSEDNRAPLGPSLAHMTWIPGGTFQMGSNDFYPEERPVHRVAGAVLVAMHWGLAILAYRIPWFGPLVKGSVVLLVQDARSGGTACGKEVSRGTICLRRCV